MKVLIVYRSRYGATQSCARRLAEKISAESVLHDLGSPGRPSLEGFDAVLIGGSIYGGKIQREITAFCDREQDNLLARKVGLFICCFFTGEKAMAELEGAFPPWLSAHAFAREVLGGAITMDRLSPLDRLMARAVVRPARDISAFRDDAIQAMAAAVNALPAR